MDFNVYSSAANAVEVVLLPDLSAPDGDRVALENHGSGSFSGSIDGVEPGQLYLVSTRFDAGTPFYPVGTSCLVADPYARQLVGRLLNGPRGQDQLDSATGALCVGVVPTMAQIEPSRCDLSARTALSRVVYEAHVKGATQRFEMIPSDLRGTYLGVASDPFIEHLLSLGVTTLELLPIFAFADEPELTQRDLTNFWGYNPVSFFAPTDRYRCSTSELSTLDQVRLMVRNLHEAGIEVVLDVVYNHTAEGGKDGPTLSFKGIDTTSYYLTEPGTMEYVNWSGTGNTFNLTSTHGLQVVMDSLRFWRAEVGVDGYRFDLGAALCQEQDGEQVRHSAGATSTLFRCIGQDPVLRDAYVVTEPWDATLEGQLIGSFGSTVGEWNGRFRDDVRRFWSGDRRSFGAFAQRTSGSQEIFDNGARSVAASLNYLTCHDGMTLYDLLSYEVKRNQANGWENTDGQNDEVLAPILEGQANERIGSVEVLRRRAAVSMIASLVLSKGVPMLLYGDEYLRSQDGNNNAYCHDAPITWTSYDPATSIVDEIGSLVALRKRLSVFSEMGWYRPRETPRSVPFDPSQDDVEFYNAAGSTLSIEEWADSPSGTLTTVTQTSDGQGAVVLVTIYNSALDEVEVVLPSVQGCEKFVVVFDGGVCGMTPKGDGGRESLTVAGKGCAVLLG